MSTETTDPEDVELDGLMAKAMQGSLDKDGGERLTLLVQRQETRRKAEQAEVRFKLVHGGLSAPEVAMLAKGGPDVAA